MGNQKNLRAMHPLYLDKQILLLANRLAQKNGWRHIDERELTKLSPKLKFPVMLAVRHGDIVQVEFGVADDKCGTNYRKICLDMKREHFEGLPLGEAVFEADDEQKR